MTDVEARVTEIWETLLGKKVTSRTANFFEMGGTSLLMIQLLWSLTDTFDVVVDVDEIYSNPVLCDIVALLEGRSR
jgi:acyl carrier protein